ncbi:hypothetical protein SAMN05421835_11539 [Amycolatopsis sacchari]|uniref:4-amino-4-deoxy-L-arabinose transferase n=1 Tax=Amycolatopsis sacchari TaxID=115433 RepID=A0A1I3XDL6_9PSEU|nr:hypothetical protein [Amycolatopsis sacchari]SFK17625.1 hypothetical protein SAMN05421835_11539 [Amycolatopsis sacchari]
MIITAPVRTVEPVAVRRRWPLLLVPAVVALVSSGWLGLNFDIRYAFGGLRNGPGGLLDNFVHRPLAYRVLVWLLDRGPSVLTPGDKSGGVAEALIRGEALLLATAVAVLLWAGLRRQNSGLTAALVAAGVWCAFALAPNWSFLQPDWTGALWATAALGAVLLPRRTAVAVAVAAVFVLLCVATKLTTAPYALLAGGVAWLFDRRRAYWTAAWSIPLSLAWLNATWLFDPLEWQWLHDMSALVPHSPLRVGLTGLDWHAFAESGANLAVVSPVVLVLPPATAVLARSAARPRLVVAGAVTAVVLAVVPVIGQGEWYLYQWIALPVLAAGLGAAALATRPPLVQTVAVLAPALTGGAVALTGPRHLPLVTAAFAGIVFIATTAACLRSTKPTKALLPLTTIAAVVAFGAANVPAAAYSITMDHSQDTNLSRYLNTAGLRERFAQLHREIGTDTTVLYFAFGDVNYLLGNPTPCRYPSPVWLQRSTFLPYVRDFPSYHDNVQCLDAPADYLLVDRKWFTVSGLEPALVARVDRLYDCGRVVHVTDTLDLCPRRT